MLFLLYLILYILLEYIKCNIGKMPCKYIRTANLVPSINILYSMPLKYYPTALIFPNVSQHLHSSDVCLTHNTIVILYYIFLFPSRYTAFLLFYCTSSINKFFNHLLFTKPNHILPHHSHSYRKHY